MMKKQFGLFLLTILVSLGLFVSDAWAVNAQTLRYYFPHSRALTIVESQPKSKDTLSLGFGFNYAMQPFEFGAVAGGRVQGILDHVFSFDFGVGYSVTDRFALGLNVPLHITNNITSLTNFTKETSASFGDISLAGLYQILLREDSSVGFGLGVMPFVTFPSGKASNFVGASNFTGGAIIVADMDYNSHYIGLNYGFRFREQENFLNLTVGQEMLYKLAYSHYIIERYDFHGFAEIGGSIVLNELASNSSPFEINAGVYKKISDTTPLTVKLAQGLGISNGYGTPDYRATVNVSYDYDLPPVFRKEKRPVYMEKIERRLKELTIYYPTDGAKVDPFYDEKIAGIVEIMNENPNIGPLYIVGHTDDVGNAGYNQKLSEKRAKQAYESALLLGVSNSRIVYYGVGESQPIVANTDAKNRALNRRTLFTFTKPVERVAPDTEYDPAMVTDSHTEVLKKRGGKTYYKEETTVKQVEVGEKEVYVNEEGEVKDEKPKPRRRYKKDKKKNDEAFLDDESTIEEVDLKEEKPKKAKKKKKKKVKKEKPKKSDDGTAKKDPALENANFDETFTEY